MLVRIMILLLVSLEASLYPYQIIYLNGTSSVGKTTLAKALQEELSPPYLLLSLDQLIGMMPSKVNWEGGAADLGFSLTSSVDSQGHPIQSLNVGSYGRQIPNLMRQLASTIAKEGCCFIIDDLAFEPDSFRAWKEALKSYQVLWVGLTAPLEVLERRERERGNRLVGQARGAYSIVHEGYIYDLFFNTNEKSIHEMVKAIKSMSTQTP